MNALLAIIADGRRVIIVIDREAVEINVFSFSLLILLLKPFSNSLVQPLAKRLTGVRFVRPSKPCRCLCVHYNNLSNAIGNDCQNGINCRQQATIIYELTKNIVINNSVAQLNFN